MIRNFTGVILAGGKSSRMKQDKGLMLVNGKLMVQHCYDSLSDICEKIIVSANSLEYLNLGYDIIQDIIPDCGPIGGIYTALQYSETDYLAIQPVDMPFLPNEIYKILYNKIDDNLLVVPEYKNRVEPLVMLVKRDLISCVQREIDNKQFKIRDLVTKYGSIINIDTLDELSRADMRNLNRPEDLI